MPWPVHLLVEIPEKIDVSSFLWWLKGKSSLIIYEKYPELSETGNLGAEDTMRKRSRRRWRRTIDISWTRTRQEKN